MIYLACIDGIFNSEDSRIDNDFDNDNGTCDDLAVYGCTDPTMLNYDSLANIDDGTCIPIVYGCMDTIACNYFEFATIDDFSCEYIDGICETCEDGFIIDNDIDNDGICDDDEIKALIVSKMNV